MTLLTDISLTRPLWAIALPLIAALAFYLRQRQMGLGDWTKVIEPQMMRALTAIGRIRTFNATGHALLPIIAAVCIVIALTGPATQVREANSYRNLDGVVFVIDVSPSMTADPLWPEVVTTGRVALASLGSRPAAMVVFAGDAYAASNLTADTDLASLNWTYLDADTVPDQGTRPHLGLNMARQILENARIVAGEVVLFTDGGGIDAATMTEATALSQIGAQLSAVYAGTARATDTVALETLVGLAGGEVFAADEFRELSKHLSRSAKERLEKQDYQILFRADFGRYLLFFTLIPLFLLFRRAV